MKILLKAFFFPVLGFALATSSCKQEDPVNPVSKKDTGMVSIRFKNVVGSDSLVFKDKWYQTTHGDSFNVTLFAYYISNIRLNRADGGAAYVQPNSYYLINGYTRPETLNFEIDSVANGTYNSITLTVGVDSLRNVSGVKTGALDPIFGYYWGWNNGYINLKFQGYPSKSTTANELQYHVGGFQAPFNTIRTVTLPLPSSIYVTPATFSNVEISADVLKLFDAPNTIRFSGLPVIHMPDSTAVKMADNYANMLKVTSAATAME